MTILTIHPEHAPAEAERLHDGERIAARLESIGVLFERWQADRDLAAEADGEAVMAAYRQSIAVLNERYGFQSVDVISVGPDHPERVALRQKFLAEHTHDDFEIRFFVAGRGLFYLHVDGRVYCVLCERGDLISVPAHTPHWFDLGESPNLKAIRFFTTPDGWVANFTGATLADEFPKMPEFLQRFGADPV